MKIPNRVRISGIEYAVEECEDVNDGIKVLAGQINYQTSIIYLNTTNFGRQSKSITLWHEIIHGILTHSSISLGKDEEKIIDVLSYGIYQVLQDNKRRFFDIKEEES